MTHPIYTEKDLQACQLSDLKRIGRQVKASPEDQRSKKSWISAILATQPQPVKAEEIPQKLVQEKTLELLGVVVLDEEDYTDRVVPEGDIQFWVHRFDDLLGTICKWTISGKVGYHPTNYSNPNKYIRFDSLFGAICELLPAQELEITYRDAFAILKQRFNSTSDYM